MIAVIAFTRNGCRLGQRLAEQLGGELYVPTRFTEEFSAQPYGELSRWTAEQFRKKNDIIFVSAAGIAVRSIAPFVRDKLADPAVISVDELGQYAIPLLSGHVGGGNALARRVAEVAGGVPVISTATDLNGRFAVDVWAKMNHLAICERERVREISSALLDGKSVGFCSEYPAFGQLPEGVSGGDSDLGFAVTDRPDFNPFPRTLHLLPKNLAVGIGCKRNTRQEHLEAVLSQIFREYNLDLQCVCQVGTIDLKRDEEGLLALCKNRGWPINFYTAEELMHAQGSFSSSEFVERTTGTDNVCERAAALMGKTLIVPKQVREGVTAAVSRIPFAVRFEET